MASNPDHFAQKQESQSERRPKFMPGVHTNAQSTHGPTRVDSGPSAVSLGKRKVGPPTGARLDRQVSAKKFKVSRSPSSLTRTSSTSIVDNLDAPVIIAHCPSFHNTVDSLALSYGVFYECARLCSSAAITYDDLLEAPFDELTGSNMKAAPETVRVLTRTSTPKELKGSVLFSDEMKAKSPWEELDREEDALRKNRLAGLGFSDDNPDWYGGKIEFRGKLQASNKIILERCRLGASCRFSRMFGSKNLLRIKVPLDILHYSKDSALVDFFRRPFILWTSVFRSFFAKDDTVFLFRTNEVMDSEMCIKPSDKPCGTGMSLLDFINWHNPLENNLSQYIGKWASRFALGLSNSMPGIRLEEEDIRYIPDVVSTEGSDMTDGCGLGNKTLHLKLYHHFKWESYPTAIQYRLGGNKGLLLQDPVVDSSENPRAYIRDSQRKIKYPSDVPADPSHLIVDIIRSSRMRSGTRLSAEVIKNLAHNGVTHSVFTDLLKSSVRTVFESLTSWDGPNAMLKLWMSVERGGNVLPARRARQIAGEARARGYTSRDFHEEADDEDDEDGLTDTVLNEQSSAWWNDQISGCPSTLEETVMILLDSGFTPQTSPILRAKLMQVIKTKIEARTGRLRLDLPYSASGLAVIDPYGVLGPDEIQIKSSRRNLLNEDGTLTDMIIGDVLITRNPCKVPTDVRKVKAVEHPALRDFVDVIVCSIQGLRRLLDFLAGGDYDGDQVIVIWFLLIVQAFTNADLKYSVVPAGVDHCFTRDTLSVGDFLETMKSESTSTMVRNAQRYLLGALRDTTLLGNYSTYHDNAIHEKGYAHPVAIKYAYKFCRLMDSAKTGHQIRRETHRYDIEANLTRGPEWKEWTKKSKKLTTYDQSNLVYLQRKSELGPCVMDTLRDAAKSAQSALLAEMDTMFSKFGEDPDSDLLQPWNDAVAKAEHRASSDKDLSGRRDLARIAIHVQNIYKAHRDSISKTFTDKRIETRQDTLRSLSKKFAESPRPEEMNTMMDEAFIARLRASYAYHYDVEQRVGRTAGSPGWTRFPWDMAMRELCHIKARALGPHKTITNDFYEHTKIF